MRKYQEPTFSDPRSMKFQLHGQITSDVLLRLLKILRDANTPDFEQIVLTLSNYPKYCDEYNAIMRKLGK